jgi:EpsI family protein
VLGLLAAAGGVILLAPSVGERSGGAGLYGLPSALSGWTVAPGAPDTALPVDPNEKISVRRTYRRGDRVLWVSVALFGRQDLPDRRASLNLIYPEKNTTRIERLPFALALNGSVDSALSLPTVMVQREQQQRLLVVYWHQLGTHAYGNEYRYRLAMMRDILLDRRADMILVRIGAPLESEERPEQALALVKELAPALYAAVKAVASGR